MPTKKKKPGSETRKLVAVGIRRPVHDHPDREWVNDTVQITGYTVSAAGALTLFCAGAVIRTIAPGYWCDVLLIGEETPPAQVETDEVPRETHV